MRQALAVSVRGAVFVALAFVVLIFSRSGPVGAQTPSNPLQGAPAVIQDTDVPANNVPNEIVIDFPNGQTCAVDPNATVRLVITDGDTEATFTAGTDVSIDTTSTGITVTNPAGGDLGVPEGFAPTTSGSVVGSEGITCRDATTNPVTPEAPSCPAGAEEVVTFTSDDTIFEPFRITDEDFRVLYTVESEQGQMTGDESFHLAVLEDGNPLTQSATVTTVPANGDLGVNDEGPGAFQLEVQAEGVVFAITVCEGAADDQNQGDNDDALDCADSNTQADAQAALDANSTVPNNLDVDNDGEACEDFDFGDDPGDVDDPDDVIDDPGGVLANTGGVPILVGAALMLVASVVVGSRVIGRR